MSDTMEEGVIAQWLKKVGDEVSSGDILAEVETDKATMELENFEDGVLLYIGVPEKEAAPVDGIIAIVGEKDEDISSLLKEIETSAGKGSLTHEDNQPRTDPSPQQDIDASTISASVVLMPKMSDTMTEGVITNWLKNVGDPIASGDVIAEVETDKATMELEAYDEGFLLYRAVEAGTSVAVDSPIAVIGEENADFKILLKAQVQKGEDLSSGESNEEPKNDETDEPKITQSETRPKGRILASPLARKMAREKDIELASIQGTGDGGRIIKRDIENYKPSIVKPSNPQYVEPQTQKSNLPLVQLPSVVGTERSEEVSLSQMRKAIAKRLSASKFTSPHFYLTMSINMDNAIAARKSMNEIAPVKISFNDLVIKAVAVALRQHPDINCSWMEDKIIKHKHIHIGVAVAIPDGLIVPVVKFADNKTLSHISTEIKALGQKAREKKLQPEEFAGSTFSVSNLGMFGVDEFTAIINPPEACILAVGGIKETAIVENGEIKAGNVMKVTLSCDHRSVDGALGAAFLKTLKDMLEDPVRILI